MNNLPYEIYDKILLNIKSDIYHNLNSLSKFYRLRIINKSFKKFIDNVGDLLYFKVSNVDNIFNRLCFFIYLKVGGGCHAEKDS